MGYIDNNYEEQNRILLLANADYETQKKIDHTITIPSIERFWGLPKERLRYFRANRKRRMHGKIKLTFKRKPNGHKKQNSML